MLNRFQADAVKRLAFTLLAVLLLGWAYLWLVSIPRQLVAMESQPVTQTPAERDLAYEAFEVSPADTDIAIAGWWMPASEPVAALVFIHGGGSNRTSSFFGSLDFYRALVERQISVAAIDLRNHGNSGRDGRGVRFGDSEQYDALAAIDWVRAREPDLPLYAMGISMGGATVIHAAASGAALDGLILLDPLLDTRDAIERGIWVETGLPAALFAPSAWSATRFFGLPDGLEQSLERAKRLALPILLLQDPGDPVTRLPFARALAAANPSVQLWLAPDVAADDPRLAWKERWGSHVAAFQLYPRLVLAQLMQFVANTSRVQAPGE